MLEVGKLYVCEEHCLMLYPDPPAASPDFWSTAPPRRERQRDASYWSNRLGKPVSYAERNIPLLVLKAEEKFYEVLSGDKKGWIIYEDWLEIREIP